MKSLTQFTSSVLLTLLRFYQWGISPYLPRACRHNPSCSQYAVIAIKVHGPRRGLLLAAKRVVKCHPLGTFGYDPVPERKNGKC